MRFLQNVKSQFIRIG